VDRNYEVVIWNIDRDQHVHYFWNICIDVYLFVFAIVFMFIIIIIIIYLLFIFFVVFLSRFLYLSYIYGREEGFPPLGWCIYQRQED
jgi:fatty acid desaturase